ncbi:MAG: DUF502 domain-containing protein [Haloferacaceae archaeon]
MSMWKRDAASGLVVLVPLLVILLVANWLFRQIADLPFVTQIQPVALRVLVAIVVLIALTFAVGYLMRTTAGRIVESYIDATMNRVPLVRVLYNASKLAVETALTGTDDLQAPVRVETWPGMRMTAFKTGKRTADGREVLFMPTAPNITTGFVIEVEPERIEPTDERVEEALTRVLSAGFAEQAGTQIAVEDVADVVDDGEGEESAA